MSISPLIENNFLFFRKWTIQQRAFGFSIAVHGILICLIMLHFTKGQDRIQTDFIFLGSFLSMDEFNKPVTVQDSENVSLNVRQLNFDIPDQLGLRTLKKPKNASDLFRYPKEQFKPIMAETLTTKNQKVNHDSMDDEAFAPIPPVRLRINRHDKF